MPHVLWKRPYVGGILSPWPYFMKGRTPFRALKPLLGDSQKLDPDNALGDRQVCPEDEATLVSSKMFGVDDNYHMPVLDIDYKATLVESSTPGHYHLYLNHWVKWEDYKKLLKAMERCGLLQPGFVNNSIKRGASFARLPGVKKGEEHAC